MRADSQALAARIDRAAFQYHYYTALPFVVLALAYFIAEIWHGEKAQRFRAKLAREPLPICARCCGKLCQEFRRRRH